MHQITFSIDFLNFSKISFECITQFYLSNKCILFFLRNKNDLFIYFCNINPVLSSQQESVCKSLKGIVCVQEKEVSNTAVFTNELVI